MLTELRMQKINKTFASVRANIDVDFDLKKGETHVLIGENGAGKTTLMNILYGLYQPDSGTISIDGNEIKITCPADSIKHGIGMVHQHFMLVENFSVAENVVLGNEPRKGRKLDRKKARQIVRDLCARYQFNLDPDMLISELSVGKQQKVEILKLLYRDADILILDEPTAVLTPTEIEELANIIHTLNSEGKSVILITHKLREVLTMSSRLTVLRNGIVTGQMNTTDATVTKLVNMMVGKNLALDVNIPYHEPSEKVLEVLDLSVRDSQGHYVVNNFNLCLRKGEIVGIAGVDGNGQSELLEALIGVRKIDSGRIIASSADISSATTLERISQGISCIAEDRHKRGVILEMPLVENTLLGNYFRPPFAKGIRIDYKATRKVTEDMVGRYDVRTPSIDTNIMWLSGGNQQKYVVAREISKPHCILLAAQPTRGVDIGAKQFIHEQLVKERGEDKGVLLVSTELDEILALSDRIVVMYKGGVSGEVTRCDANEQLIGRLMIGQHEEG